VFHQKHIAIKLYNMLKKTVWPVVRPTQYAPPPVSGDI